MGYLRFIIIAIAITISIGGEIVGLMFGVDHTCGMLICLGFLGLMIVVMRLRILKIQKQRREYSKAQKSEHR